MHSRALDIDTQGFPIWDVEGGGGGAEPPPIWNLSSPPPYGDMSPPPPRWIYRETLTLGYQERNMGKQIGQVGS